MPLRWKNRLIIPGQPGNPPTQSMLVCILKTRILGIPYNSVVRLHTLIAEGPGCIPCQELRSHKPSSGAKEKKKGFFFYTTSSLLQHRSIL